VIQHLRVSLGAALSWQLGTSVLQTLTRDQPTYIVTSCQGGQYAKALHCSTWIVKSWKSRRRIRRVKLHVLHQKYGVFEERREEIERILRLLYDLV